MLSHKWVHQTLVDRGIPSPGSAAIGLALMATDEPTLQRLQDVLAVIAKGTEKCEDVQWVLDAIRRAPPANHQSFAGASTAGGDETDLRCDDELLVEQHAAELWSADASSEPSGQFDRPKCHIYGAKGALTIELDKLRERGQRGEIVYTINIEAASAVATREYGWGNKISFQVMRREQSLLACMLLGLTSAPLELANHGSKTLSIQDVGGALLVRLSKAARVVAVRVGPADVYAWATVLLDAMQRNAAHIPAELNLAALKRVGAMLSAGHLATKEKAHA